MFFTFNKDCSYYNSNITCLCIYRIHLISFILILVKDIIHPNIHYKPFINVYLQFYSKCSNILNCFGILLDYSVLAVFCLSNYSGSAVNIPFKDILPYFFFHFSLFFIHLYFHMSLDWVFLLFFSLSYFTFIFVIVFIRTPALYVILCTSTICVNQLL